MRQVLFYISLDAPFSILPNGLPDFPLLTVGAGYILLALLVLLGIWQTFYGPKNLTGKDGKPVPPGAMYLNTVLPFVIAAAAAWFLSPVRIFPVFGYGMMLLIAFLAGATWAGKRAVKVGLPKELVWDVAMCILVSGIAGARIFYLVQKRDQVFQGVNGAGDFFYRVINLTDGGLVFYGGLILATISYFVFCAIRKVRPLELADVVVPSLFLGLGFGRLGCLLNGCCYGDRCDLPWAITFPAESVPWSALVNLGFLSPDAAVSFPLHPSQIYSSIGGFLLAFVTAMVFKYRQRTGEVLAVGAILYPINRFLIEFVRGDEFTVLNTGLTPSQNTSILVVAAGIAFLIWLELKGQRRPEGSDLAKSSSST